MSLAEFGTSIMDRNAFLFYRKKASKIRKQKVNRELFPTIVNAIFQEISDGIIEKESGVLVPRLGYFGVWMTPCKKKTRIFQDKRNKITYNLHTDSYIYHLALFTDVYTKMGYLKYFSMDRTFSKNIKSRLSKSLKVGRKYTLKYLSIKKVNTGK